MGKLRTFTDFISKADVANICAGVATIAAVVAGLGQAFGLATGDTSLIVQFGLIGFGYLIGKGLSK